MSSEDGMTCMLYVFVRRPGDGFLSATCFERSCRQPFTISVTRRPGILVVRGACHSLKQHLVG